MKSLRILLAAGCVLGLELGSALGQGIESCNQCICVADGGCDGGLITCSGSDSGCEGVSFTALCSGTYHIRYSLSCSGEACNECYACVIVRDSEGNEIGSCHSDCANEDCTGDCFNALSLTANEEYKLYVCLRVCDEGSCLECEGCVARGYVYNGNFATTCSTIPACNP